MLLIAVTPSGSVPEDVDAYLLGCQLAGLDTLDALRFQKPQRALEAARRDLVIVSLADLGHLVRDITDGSARPERDLAPVLDECVHGFVRQDAPAADEDQLVDQVFDLRNVMCGV